MPTESNTGSDIGQDALKTGAKATIKVHDRGEVRHLASVETPRERMVRVIKTVRKKRKS